MYHTLFSREPSFQSHRLQRAVQLAVATVSDYRSQVRSGFPAINVSNSTLAVDLYCFVPDVDAKDIEVKLDKNTLTISGERKEIAHATEAAKVHAKERFVGRFRRVITLPDDIDTDALSAQYRDGVLHINVPRAAAEQSRHITIQ